MVKKPTYLYVLISIIILLISILTYLLLTNTNPILKDFVEIFDYKNPHFDDPLTKYYKSAEFDTRATNFFNNDPKESFIINTVLNKFGEYGDIFVYGGFVRDLCVSLKPRGDLDFNFSVNNKEDVDKVCKENNINYIDISEVRQKTKYVIVQITELTSCQTIHKAEIKNMENDVNSMFYDCKRKVIIDLTGTGFLNNLNHVFRIVQPSFESWANVTYHGHLENKTPFRVFKMFKSGYKMQEEGEKTLKNLKTWFRQKIDFYKNNLVNYPPENNIWPIIPWTFLHRCRGDKVNPYEVAIIKRGKDEIYLGEILYEIYKFDNVLHKEIIENLIIYDPTLEKYRYF